MVNIGAAGSVMFAIRKDSLPVKWRLLAKDGADLPPVLRVEGPSRRRITTGETIDAEWTPTEPGEYLFTLGGRKPFYYSRKILVR